MNENKATVHVLLEMQRVVEEIIAHVFSKTQRPSIETITYVVSETQISVQGRAEECESVAHECWLLFPPSTRKPRHRLRFLTPAR